jgi:hypothetical protein
MSTVKDMAILFALDDCTLDEFLGDILGYACLRFSDGDPDFYDVQYTCKAFFRAFRHRNVRAHVFEYLDRFYAEYAAAYDAFVMPQEDFTTLPFPRDKIPFCLKNPVDDPFDKIAFWLGKRTLYKPRIVYLENDVVVPRRMLLEWMDARACAPGDDEAAKTEVRAKVQTEHWISWVQNRLRDGHDACVPVMGTAWDTHRLPTLACYFFGISHRCLELRYLCAAHCSTPERTRELILLLTMYAMITRGRALHAQFSDEMVSIVAPFMVQDKFSGGSVDYYGITRKLVL